MTGDNTTEYFLEVGCEEIPARAMAPVLDELRGKVRAFLGENKLEFGSVETLGSARRLVVRVTGLAKHQNTGKVTTLGPPESVAYKDGRPTRALEGFAKKSGVALDDLSMIDTGRGRYVGFEAEVGGAGAGPVLASGVGAVIAGLTFPKTMYWQPSGVRFARPVRWIVSLLDGEVLEFELFGVRAGASSAGHRILGSQSIPVRSFDDYVRRLGENYVIVSESARRQKVRSELDAAAVRLGGALIENPGLMEEVIYINEYPTVVVGRFERRFLDLPREVSITVMREHQKYFAVEGEDGTLLPNFLGVMNAAEDVQGHILRGHERVLKARLSDASFFWEMDGRKTLEERRERLGAVVFHKKLGSYSDKVDRMQALAPVVNQVMEARIDPATLRTVVALSKSDLVTDLVGEFPDLQGIVGGLYARREGASVEVWRAIYDQYRPLSLADAGPETPAGAVLSITDRLDTLFGCFSVGLVPTGSADPLALRRNTQGVIKILIDHRVRFDLGAVAAADSRLDDASTQAFRQFFEDRLRYILGQSGFAHDTIGAGLGARARRGPAVDDPTDVLARVEAMEEVHESPDLVAIAGAFKRIRNILKQASETRVESVSPSSDGVEHAEAALTGLVDALAPEIREHAERREYREALRKMAASRPAIDEFFLRILVMHEDAGIRKRRIVLLRRLVDTFLEVADVSEIVVS
jgi:glycyl-tRNA synthetase beta chain